jgi:hypothetical protein
MENKRPFVAAAAGITPIIAPSAAALASLAFFRPWLEFAVSPENATATVSGATLARQYSTSIPWVYVTPAALVVILIAASLLLLKQNRRIQTAAGLVMCLLAAPSIIWPLEGLARLIRSISHLSSGSDTASVALSGWWWLYSGSLCVIILSGIINLVAAIRYRNSKGVPASNTDARLR